MGVVGRAVSPPAAVALRRRDGLAAADGRAVRQPPTSSSPRATRREKMAKAFAKMSREHGMPMSTAVLERMAASAPACRAVVAARLHAPAAEDALLRAFRVRNFAGELLDDPATLERRGRRRRPRRRAAARLDACRRRRARARGRSCGSRASPAAPRACSTRSSPTGRAGGATRCPSLRSSAAATACASPCPAFSRSPPLTSCSPISCPDPSAARRRRRSWRCCEWAGEPLATREVAVLCDIDHDEARQQLGRVAGERHVGYDGLWSPA